MAPAVGAADGMGGWALFFASGLAPKAVGAADGMGGWALFFASGLAPKAVGAADGMRLGTLLRIRLGPEGGGSGPASGLAPKAVERLMVWEAGHSSSHQAWPLKAVGAAVDGSWALFFASGLAPKAVGAADGMGGWALFFASGLAPKAVGAADGMGG